MEPDQQLRNLRDFLLVYNRMTEICFQRCSSNFNYRSLTMDEERCVDNCAGKLIRSNHRLMGTYVQLMPRMVQRRMEEMESKTAEAAKAAEAAEAAAAGAVEGLGPAVPVIPEGLPVAEAPIIPPPSSEVPSFMSPAVTDVAPVQTFNIPGQTADIDLVSTPSPVIGEAMPTAEVPSSVFKPTGLEFPIELGPASSPLFTEERMTAATPLTPASETVTPSVLTNVVTGPAYTVAPPLELPPIRPEPPLPLASALIESVISVPQSLEPLPVLTPARPVTLSEEPTVSTIAAPTLSQATERLAEVERGSSQ